MRSTIAIAIPVALAAFLCGQLAVRDSRAQNSALAATIYVPSDGLVFRTFDGHVVAKLSYDAHGGALEVFDEHEKPATTVRNGVLGPAWRTSTAAPAASEARPLGERPDLGF